MELVIALPLIFFAGQGVGLALRRKILNRDGRQGREGMQEMGNNSNRNDVSVRMLVRISVTALSVLTIPCRCLLFASFAVPDVDLV